MPEENKTKTDSKTDKKTDTKASDLVHKTVESWKEVLETPAWLFAATKAKHRWAVGFLVTEQEYKEALEATKSEVIR